MPVNIQRVFVDHGGVVRDGEKVMEVIPGEKVTVRTARATYRSSSVVLAAGPWANILLRPLGLQLPLQVRRPVTPLMGP